MLSVYSGSLSFDRTDQPSIVYTRPFAVTASPIFATLEANPMTSCPYSASTDSLDTFA